MFSQYGSLQGRQLGGKGNSVSRERNTAETYILPSFLYLKITAGIVSLNVALEGFSTKILFPHLVLMSVYTLESPGKTQEPYSAILPG